MRICSLRSAEPIRSRHVSVLLECRASPAMTGGRIEVRKVWTRTRLDESRTRDLPVSA